MMNNKVLFSIGIVVLFGCIFTLLATVVNAKGLNILCSEKQNIKVILKNEADIEKSKDVISKIPQIKIIKITYRDKEWSKMVNRTDLPNMENPFKNEFIVKVNKKANKDEIANLLKEMSFIEDVKSVSDRVNTEK